ncbi:EGF-like domain-containing protein [Dictyostelium discoideum AX4]|uniref:EGF-like domain-containing protein n=1 Tax=Dictyostelium discoideum TaxID=44689 RepID=Q558U5_DICDI|nr:EGF-like domain-containing protein [Dictyostelium discoideum AX4]EAL71062.2 EGF-like domain-containing protein [Dictyostelium discoideum AX4]|eukprot:XP_644971.2 EGF-like domain-containing protein [Dictyostelium discoideum AX4]
MKYNLPILIILLISFISFVNSVDLVSEEVPYLYSIIQKVNDTKLNIPNIETIICSGVFFGSRCNSNGNLESLTLRSTTNEILSWSDFNGFTKLYYLYMAEVSVDQNFAYFPIPSIGYLSIHNKLYFEFDKVLPKYDNVYINFQGEGINSHMNIKASYLKDVTSFTVLGAICDIEIDGDQSGNKLSSLFFNTKNIPDVSSLSFLRTLSFNLGNDFNQSSLVNILSFSKLTYIGMGFSNSNPLNFPTEFSNIINPMWGTIYFTQGNWGPPADYIDLSNSNQTLVSFSLKNAGKKFNINGNFPFSKLPTGTCSNFIVENGNFSTLPDLSIFQRAQQFSLSNSEIGGNLPSVKDTLQKSAFTQTATLSNNKLTGSIDESWCSISLDVSNNLLSGSLPDCYYCYLQDPTYQRRLVGNNFSNYNLTSTCNDGQINVYKFLNLSSTRVTLIGKNIGTNLDNIVTYPEIKFSSNNLNDSFSGYFSVASNQYDIIQIRFLIPGINFTVSIAGNAPQIDTIIQNNATFEITGQYYSYDKSVVNVKIGNNDCIVKSTTFYKIICDINYPIVDYGNKSFTVMVEDKSTTTYFNLIHTPVPCKNPTCNSNGICNDHMGVCACFKEWTSEDCLIPIHNVTNSTKVPVESGGAIKLYGWFGDIHLGISVSFNGVSSLIDSINSNTIYAQIGKGFGFVKTEVTQNGITWSGLINPYLQPENGYCNETTKQCTCNNKWTSLDNEICTIPYHYVSSSSKVPSTSGGNISISGFFGDVHKYFQFSFDNEIIPINSIDNETIVISIPPGVGLKNIEIIQNNITWSGSIYPYSESTINCLNNCSGNGNCNSNGECKCNSGFIGLDCLTKDVGESKPPTETKVNPDGTTTIINEDTVYLIYIDSIAEIDLNNNQVPNSLINLKSGWKITNTTNNLTGSGSLISTFSQIVNNATIIMTIENIESNNGKEFTFAGNQFTVSKDGFKLSLSVSNWNYKSNLNTLQIQMSSDISTTEGKINNCIDSEHTNVETSPNSNNLQNVNYLKISKNGKTLYGRFQDKMLSDGRPTTTITKIISKDDKKVLISLDMPHCNQCLLDPDFSVIINSDFKSSDSCGKENKKPWLIPVAVTVPVVGCALIIAAFMLRKKIHSNKILLNKFGGK